MPETYKAEVVRQVYSKETFRIMVVTLSETGKSVSVLGNFAQFFNGAQVEILGEIAEHPTRGTQIKATQVTEIVPTTEEGLISYLGGGSFPGVGKTYAKRIVDAFGERTEHVLSNESELLYEVYRVPARVIDQLVEAWQSRREMHEVITFFRKAGLGEALSTKVYEKWKDEAVGMVKENPYSLMAITGIGFQTADQVGLKLGLPGDSPHRIQAAIMHVMDGVTEDGDTCITGRNLYFKVMELLEDVEDLKALFMPNLNALIDRSAMYSEKSLGESVFYKFFMHHNEDELSKMFKELVATPPDRQFFEDNTDQQGLCAPAPAHPAGGLNRDGGRPDPGRRPSALAAPQVPQGVGGAQPPTSLSSTSLIGRRLKSFEEAMKITLSDKQRLAVHQAAQHSVVVITGGPGTGKTTVLSALLDALDGCLVAMAAPTGKAANVMKMATGYHSSTIHKLLEWSAEEGDFTRNRRNPLEADLVVIDEMSMLDLPLASCLVDAINPGSRLVLVGDVDQLPSVGPGAVLRDIIRSGTVPTVRLDHVYRQGVGSAIAHNAQRILRGEEPKSAEDFFILKGHDDAKAKERVLQLVTDILPRKFGLSPKTDIQVLVPKHKGDAGRVELNAALQAALNPPVDGGLELMVMGQVFRKGDRVMQLKNQVSQDGVGVFNGETGVVQIVEKDTLKVLYPGDRTATYTKDSLEQLTLAYASTIHKSQGGEFPAVVVVILGSAGWMLNKNLLYTAITRARKVACIVTDDDARAVKTAIKKSGSERITKLAERLTMTASVVVEPDDEDEEKE